MNQTERSELLFVSALIHLGKRMHSGQAVINSQTVVDEAKELICEVNESSGTKPLDGSVPYDILPPVFPRIPTSVQKTSNKQPPKPQRRSGKS